LTLRTLLAGRGSSLRRPPTAAGVVHIGRDRRRRAAHRSFSRATALHAQVRGLRLALGVQALEFGVELRCSPRARSSAANRRRDS
jgi:hypothetical protein